jgi:hypothetical protein
MRTKVFDRIESATTHATHCKCTGGSCSCTTKPFNQVAATAAPERKLPGGVSGWLKQYGLSVDNLYASGGRLSVAQIDQHFAARTASPSDRMSVKDVLRQFNLLEG